MCELKPLLAADRSTEILPLTLSDCGPGSGVAVDSPGQPKELLTGKLPDKSGFPVADKGCAGDSDPPGSRMLGELNVLKELLTSEPSPMAAEKSYPAHYYC